MAATSSVLGRGLGLVLVEFEYEYQGREGELVSIKPNERYVLLAKTNDHWWQVRRDSASKPFYIPAKYVKELPGDFPSPLGFDGPPSPEPAPVATPVPVPVPIPVPKTLEESGGKRTKQGDEVTIRLKPEAPTGYRKNENRMSTFGVPLDFQDLPHLPRTTNAHSGPSETGTTTTSRDSSTTDGGLSKKQTHLPPYPDDHKDSAKPRVPSFSPTDSLSTSRSQTQPIPVETPVVPPVPSVGPSIEITPSSPLECCPDNPEPLVRPEVKVEEEEEEEVVPEEESSMDESSKDEEDSLKEKESNHIYESIQDLNLDLEALVGGRESPGTKPGPEPGPEPDPEPTPAPAPVPHTQDPTPPIYANISSAKKTSLPHVSSDLFVIPPPPSEPAPLPTDHAHSSSSSVSSSGLMSPASPVSEHDQWQVHRDYDSGKAFYFHPLTKRTTWTDPRSPTTPPDALASPLSSPASSQGSGWEQLLDEASGRIYFFNRTTGVTSWTVPESLSPSSPLWSPGNRKHDDSPPPLPEEDYPVEGASDKNDTVFTTNPQQPVAHIPRAHLELKDGTPLQWKLPEVPHLPQSRMGNGVSEDGSALQVRTWRHSVAEETFSLGHRRNVSDFTDTSNRRLSPDSAMFSEMQRLKRNLSNRSADSHQHGHLLEKAGIINKTKVVDNGKKIRKNWSQSWTVLHGGILTFHRDPKSAPAGNANKASHIVPEYTVDLRGSAVCWAAKDKSSKKNVLELKTRDGCEYLMQYDTESIITDWLKVIMEAVRQLEQEVVVTDDDEDTASDREDKEKTRTSTRGSSSGNYVEQRRVRTKLRRFLQRRPTLQSVKEKGYIRDNVFGCHLDTLCHREHTTIPAFVQKCIKVVERRGLDIDGIYRVSGNLAVIQKLRHKADHEEQLDLDDGQWQEIHVITGALKLFLRELPEPLFPFSCFDKFIAAIQVPDHNLKVSYMKDLVRLLPLPNHDTMELLFKHLRKVIEHKESNRMSFQSVAIVFGPTLLRPLVESANMTIHMVFQSQIVELMLSEFQTIFSET